MLHLANGDATAGRIRAAGLPGEVAVWRDALSEGPVPNGLASPADWKLRVAAGMPDTMAEDAGLLEALGGQKQVVLWADEDLFCQANLAYVLAHLADDWVGAADVKLASEGHEGLHTPERTATAFARRQTVGPRQAALAAAFWEQYGSADPEPLAELLKRGFPSWRWFGQGLARHLERFPNENGLGLAEETALHALHDGALPFGELFRKLQSAPAVVMLGWGDLQVAAMLRDLARAPVPLVRIDGPAADPHGWSLRILADANPILAGEDAIARRGIDRWLGGVHLQGKGPAWRWDGLSLRRR
ncbi:MAG: DUF1835 domain-containing protein [Halobacteriales archaeon]|nr:DUF1835 domain-containing protein [Halobacteriales archaeon]